MDANVYRLADCGEFRQTLLARPPALVRVSWVAAAAVILTAIGWAAGTRADLVVRCPARVRPASAPDVGFGAVSGHPLAFPVGGRVAGVGAKVGQTVTAGEVLVQLDTDRVDNEIRRRAEAVRAAADEIARLAAQQELTREHERAATGKAEAELAQGQEEVRQARERRLAELQSGEAELERAADEEARQEHLYRTGAGSPTESQAARVKHREAAERVVKARQPVEDNRLAALKGALATTQKDFALRQKELETRRGQRGADLAAARADLANLEGERRQHVLTAPFDGVVTLAEAQPGDAVASGKPVVAVAAAGRVRVDLAVPSRDIGSVRVGMTVKVKLDSFDFQQYGTLDGTVAAIAPDAEPADPKDTSARAAVYVVQVEVAGADVGRGDRRGRVRIGMTGHGEIVTDHERLLVVLLRKIRQTVSLN